ncbi:glycoside hydrolase family 71/99-like protein [Rhodopirellula baltica]|uniref:Xylosidase/arabinosidase n=1 Tax=Rhodopirellula baltica WH47 TaxID=991778 RepID=F2AUA0_RHOBT|nr:glycoside hydrolase family 71/99-like protein [Rhodopirellula baltica]EGF26756.1 xylosidase/arabinosidase [Rhodopirellula baltica WH47]
MNQIDIEEEQLSLIDTRVVKCFCTIAGDHHHLTMRKCVAFALLSFVHLLHVSYLANVDASEAEQSAKTFDTYHGLVMTGYQGWFNAEGDGAGRRWTHYSRKGRFEPGHCTIDFWPDVSEYRQTYETPFRYADGSAARVFSSYDASTVDLHFKWMAEYGIDGAFMQRFVHSLEDSKVANHYDVVFDSAISVAAKYNRAISIRYDLTSMREGTSQVLLDDLDKLSQRYGFHDREASPTFLYHKGKPLIAIGGVGFSDDIAGKSDVGFLREGALLVEQLRARGYSIMLRVPAQWRTLRGEMVVQTTDRQDRLHEIIRSCDIVMPWHVGAYREESYVRGKWKQRIAEDIQWCRSNGIEYVPVIYPGFSRANLKGGEDGSFRPRNQGSFYWLQASSAIDVDAKMLFVAQFDEMDEGTQIFKCSCRVPVGESSFVAYEAEIGTDHYLWLTGEIGKLLRGEKRFSTALPSRLSDSDGKDD